MCRGHETNHCVNAVRTLLLTLSTFTASCAGQHGSPPPPTDEEIAACEAQGGSFEHIYALDTYACRLPPENVATP